MLALLFGMAGTVRATRGCASLNRVYVEFFRGTATLVLLYWFFYALPLIGLRFTTDVRGACWRSASTSAPTARRWCAARSRPCPRAQYEATVGAQLPPYQRMRRVLLPQAVALMLPPFGNLLIELMKGDGDRVAVGHRRPHSGSRSNIRAATGETVCGVPVVLVLYFVIAQVLQLLVRYAERRADRMLGRRLPRGAVARRDRGRRSGAVGAGLMTGTGTYAGKILPDLLRGLRVTVEATLAGYVLALVLGLVWTLLRRSPSRVVSQAVRWITEFIRSHAAARAAVLPVLRRCPRWGLTIGPLTTGIIRLGMHYSTYTSEVYRAGIADVPRRGSGRRPPR